MEVIHARFESKELKMLRSLNLRMKLNSKDSNYFSYLEKGFEGEKNFDRLLESHLSNDWLAVNDLLLEYNNKRFQIDSLLKSRNTFHLYDVKNFDGDYVIKNGKWYSAAGNEIDDPVEQLRKCESRLRRLLLSLGITSPIESNLVFMNPQFYLYQAPLGLPIIFLPQLPRHISNLQKKSGKLNQSDFKLAEKLVSLNITNVKFPGCPEYSYEKLEKGVACIFGHSFMKMYNKETLICPQCEQKESLESAVLRSVEELLMLFPNCKITTVGIHDWCEVIPSLKTIRRILMNNCIHQGSSKSAHFVQKH